MADVPYLHIHHTDHPDGLRTTVQTVEDFLDVETMKLLLEQMKILVKHMEEMTGSEITTEDVEEQ